MKCAWGFSGASWITSRKVLMASALLPLMPAGGHGNAGYDVARIVLQQSVGQAWASSILPVLSSVSSSRTCKSAMPGAKSMPRLYSLIAASGFLDAR